MKLLSFFLLFLSSQLLFGQVAKLESFEMKTDRFLSTHVLDDYVDYASIGGSNSDLVELVKLMTKIDLSTFNDSHVQSFYINAYNILVIDQVVRNYPTTSVKEISGFFNRIKHEVAGKNLTLDNIEKDILLGKYKDSRFHFVLVCGAKDCPKLWNRAFTSNGLNEQLEDRTRAALNDPSFLKVTDDGLGLSEIFRWNRFEFGGKKEILKFINSYRENPFDLDQKTSFYDYDWTLNDTKFKESTSFSSANNSFRYVTSAAIPKGGIEVKIFNNLYSQTTVDQFSNFKRSTYFTTSLSFLYGKSNRFNYGFSARYRRVRIGFGNSSVFDVFESSDNMLAEQGLTAFGPQIRWAPNKDWPNFSIQSSLVFPLRSGLSGGIDTPFLDWSGPVFLTQFFNDKAIGSKLALFTEIDLLVEEIGGSGKANRVSTPITAIFSWFPIKNFTIYGLINYSPYYEKPYDYFMQYGTGMKYQISRNFEIEILYTDFSNRFLNSIDSGEAATYNIGFRYSR